jgi:hypothetical protein
MTMRKPIYESSLHAPGLMLPPARRALCLVLLLALPGGARNAPGLQSRGTLAQPIGRHSLADADVGSGDPAEEEKRLRALNAERQKSLVADANKLLKLARELDAEVSAANLDSLTPAQLRKVVEIEKLAHSVKEKMSTSVREAPMLRQPVSVQLQ